MKFIDIKSNKTNVTGLSEELQSVYINNIFEEKNSNVLVVTNSLYEANKLYNSISNYNSNVLLFPMDNFITTEASIGSPELEVNRLETLNNIVSTNENKIVITNLMGLLRYLPTKENYVKSIIKLKVNEEINKDKLFRDLCNIGYKVETLVSRTGDISSRGFIIDIFPINEDNAIRLEFFGDFIESIRYFDVNTQLSIKKVNEITITAFSEFITDKDLELEEKKQKNLPKYEKVSMLSEYLNEPIIIYKDYTEIYNSYLALQKEIENYNKEMQFNEKYMHNLGEIKEFCCIYISSVDSILPNVNIIDTHNYDSHDAPNFNDNIEKINESISDYINLGKTVVVCLDNESQLKNFIRILNFSYVKSTMKTLKENTINLMVYPITKGYIFDNYVVLSSSNIFTNIINKSLYKSKFKIGTRIKDVDSLNVGDYVVHNTHGIGLYQGIVALKKGTIVKDYLQIVYKDNGKLYIPVEKIELISKYSSGDGIVPSLNKLGGTEWQKTKLRVTERVRNVAKELLRIAVERRARKGYAFSKDTAEQQVFESEFVYDETKDQMRAINAIKKEMEASNPMDMLLCGDVGYGKTEVAFRAIFKAICNNKQVAYLCPTTILSNQQYNSALSRFKNFPINIALLNRFTSEKDKNIILKKLEEGKIDILFGTHRILSDDIKFKDLGLLVVDEEQRFGVTHKEKLKKYKSTIDVLTLSATPIPRTLQMSMVGIRSLALIETPPNNRYPVQTYVLEENEHVIKDAIYKEISRNGQVYILCNRIESFEERIRLLTELIPGIKIGYAHGKMNKNEIENIMLKFVNREFDVLLCTTIIETGIDISNANTLIILDADKFGLSQLYQIRGRVGRTNRVAYAYLMYGKHKVLSDIAKKRLSAIKEFAQLGSGFAIAKRDLSIRGAGDVLGEEQSGFIDTIGVELYLKILNEEVEKITNNVSVEVNEEKDETPSLSVATHIEDSYVSEDELKIEIHKIINRINSYETLEKAKEEIEDRFGHISDNLLIYMYEELFESLKEKKGIERVKQNDKSIEITFNMDKSNSIKADELFVTAYKISRNFKLSYLNKRLILILSINKLEKHWIYYIIELLENI